MKNVLIGRYTRKAIKHPETNEVIVPENDLITEDLAREIVDAGIEEVYDSFCIYM